MGKRQKQGKTVKNNKKGSGVSNGQGKGGKSSYPSDYFFGSLCLSVSFTFFPQCRAWFRAFIVTSTNYMYSLATHRNKKTITVYLHLSDIHVLMISTDLVLHFCFFTNNMLRFYATLLISLHFSWTDSGLSKSDNYEIFF